MKFFAPAPHHLRMRCQVAVQRRRPAFLGPDDDAVRWLPGAFLLRFTLSRLRCLPGRSISTPLLGIAVPTGSTRAQPEPLATVHRYPAARRETPLAPGGGCAAPLSPEHSHAFGPRAPGIATVLYSADSTNSCSLNEGRNAL